MLVTVFTSHSMKGLQAVTGEQSVKQIEEFYHTNYTGVLVVFGILLWYAIGIAVLGKK